MVTSHRQCALYIRISKIDKELDDIIDCDEALDYVDAPFLNKPEPKMLSSSSATQASSVFQPRASPVPMQFVPDQDDDSVSTFGTAAYKTPAKFSPQPSLEDTQESSTVISSITMESRVSQVESTLGDLKSMLQTLVSNSTAAQGPPLGGAGTQG